MEASNNHNTMPMHRRERFNFEAFDKFIADVLAECEITNPLFEDVDKQLPLEFS